MSKLLGIVAAGGRGVNIFEYFDGGHGVNIFKYVDGGRGVNIFKCF